ncbi:MAG: adenosylmethionine--8-amino-7-oxononanoate transaminase [Myxococcales bacterium]|nr:adenosylmethionine--8-amino-7-oxononanoate transaminase [Myxococcales bacterium]
MGPKVARGASPIYKVRVSWSERDKQVLWHPFTQAAEWCAGTPLVIDRAEGNYLIDTDGRRYLDGVSSLWVTTHGHGVPSIARAIAEQAARLDHSTLLGLTHPPAIQLAERLVALAPEGLTRVFYSDSGSTAVEIALKQAFQYWALMGRPSKQRFIHLAESYHGDTLGAVGVGGMGLFHRIFGPLVVAGIKVPTPALEPAIALPALRELLDRRADEIAALVIEPLIQGAAGMLVHPPGYLAAVADLCHAHDVLLIVDEVATGFGRTGTVFACEQERVRPDLMCVAKGLTGGTLPLAATLSTERIYQAFVAPRQDLTTFFHGHTYTGNPIACAAALANLDLLADPTVLASVQTATAHMAALLANLAEIPVVHQVRQVGLMAGIELRRPNGEPLPFEQFVGTAVCDRARAHGVILRPLSDVIVWMPPLSIGTADLDHMARATRAAIIEVLG